MSTKGTSLAQARKRLSGDAVRLDSLRKKLDTCVTDATGAPKVDACLCRTAIDLANLASEMRERSGLALRCAALAPKPSAADIKAAVEYLKAGNEKEFFLGVVFLLWLTATRQQEKPSARNLANAKLILRESENVLYPRIPVVWSEKFIAVDLLALFVKDMLAAFPFEKERNLATLMMNLSLPDRALFPAILLMRYPGPRTAAFKRLYLAAHRNAGEREAIRRLLGKYLSDSGAINRRRLLPDRHFHYRNKAELLPRDMSAGEQAGIGNITTEIDGLVHELESATPAAKLRLLAGIHETYRKRIFHGFDQARLDRCRHELFRSASGKTKAGHGGKPDRAAMERRLNRALSEPNDRKRFEACCDILKDCHRHPELNRTALKAFRRIRDTVASYSAMSSMYGALFPKLLGAAGRLMHTGWKPAIFDSYPLSKSRLGSWALMSARSPHLEATCNPIPGLRDSLRFCPTRTMIAYQGVFMYLTALFLAGCERRAQVVIGKCPELGVPKSNDIRHGCVRGSAGVSACPPPGGPASNGGAEPRPPRSCSQADGNGGSPR